MKFTSNWSLTTLLFALLLTSCVTSREIVYLKNIEEVSLKEIKNNYEAKIKKDDLLNIVVSGPDKTVIMPYNLTISETVSGAGQIENSTLPYLVDPNGDIDFPIFGKIHVEGMTRAELREYLTSKIAEDVKDPIVYVSFKNYKVTILGEVRNPGTYNMSSEKTNIFQALGMAGDLNFSALRDGIILIREVDGKQSYHKIDLKDASVLNDPYYFLQQNDILYIPPSAQRITQANTSTGIWGTVLSSITTALSILTTVIALTK